MSNYVVFVHGIGEQQPGYSSGFAKRLTTAYRKELTTAKNYIVEGELVFEECYWADITQPDEQELQKRLGTRGLLRKLMLGSLGDAVAYSKLPYPPDKYGEIQMRFAAVIDKVAHLAREADDRQDSLTVISHSLGTVIASDGIWDQTRTSLRPTSRQTARLWPGCLMSTRSL